MRPVASTFIVEVDRSHFRCARASTRMDEEETRAIVRARVCAGTLDGHALISNNSIWRQFPIVHNERWSVRRTVLVGDALHTAHFSIGSGTRLAIEDAIALDKALAAHGDDIDAALAAYETGRRPILEKLVAGANGSATLVRAFQRSTCSSTPARLCHELRYALRPN